MDWNTPTTSSVYSDLVTQFKTRDASLANMFDGETNTNLPTGAKRWNSLNSRFEKWTGSVWENLSTALTDVCKTANNLSDLADAVTARTNLGLGSLAVKGSVNNADWSGTSLALANGGHGASDAAGARTNLGLGTIATQAASAVAITGGSLSGITGMTMTASSTLDMTSAGTVDKVALVRNNSNLALQATSGTVGLSNSTVTLYLSAADLRPSADQAANLGTGSYRYNAGYISNLYPTKIYPTTRPDYTISTAYTSLRDFDPNAVTGNLGEVTSKLNYLSRVVATMIDDAIALGVYQ